MSHMLVILDNPPVVLTQVVDITSVSCQRLSDVTDMSIRQGHGKGAASCFLVTFVPAEAAVVRNGP